MENIDETRQDDAHQAHHEERTPEGAALVMSARRQVMFGRSANRTGDGAGGVERNSPDTFPFRRSRSSTPVIVAGVRPTEASGDAAQ